MLNIRQGVFETNSSSMHSLAILNEEGHIETREEILEELGNLYEYTDKNDNKIWDNSEDVWYFERYPLYILSNFVEKFKYMYADNNEEEALKIFKEILPDVEFIPPKDCYCESYWSIEDKIKKLNISLKDFLLNDRYLIILDGDEYLEFNKLLFTGVLNKNKLVNKDNYNLENFEWTI